MTDSIGAERQVREVAAFDVEATPAVQGNHRISGNGRIYEVSSRALKDWREHVAWTARLVMRERAPLTGPVMARLAFRLSPPKKGAPPHPVRRPDLDKLTRAVLDALTGVAFADDSQVIELTLNKRYGVPGCHITIWEVLG